MEFTTVANVMTTYLITVSPTQTVADVAHIFSSTPIHHIPVVDASKQLVGIISQTDFERMKIGNTLFRNPKIEDYNEALFESMLVQDIMTKDVVQIRPTDSIIEAYSIFRENRFRAIPVTENEVLQGIITPLDILHHFFKDTEQSL